MEYNDSKSFLTMMSLMLKAVLYPGVKAAVTTGGKEQAASITIAKIEEICKLIPSLANEINWDRGATRKSKDNVQYIFKNGSTIDILAARESSRGQRRNCIVVEEAILIDGDALNEIIIPTTNVDRILGDGSKHEEELVNKSQTFITTAGWKNSFPRPKKFIGEVKPGEPQNEGVVYYRLLTLKAKKYVTVCQAA